MLLRWLKDLVFRVNRAVVTDENGNIAYGGSAIPSDVWNNSSGTLDTIHLFYGSGLVEIYDRTGNVFNRLINGYLRDNSGSPQWVYLNNGNASLFQQRDSSSLFINTFVAISGTAGNAITWNNIFNIDPSGNVNIKTGATYSATL